MAWARVVLPGARRPPEDHRRQPVGLDQRAQRLPGPEQVRPGRRCRRASAAAAGPPAAPGRPARPPPPRRTGRPAIAATLPDHAWPRPSHAFTVHSQPFPPSTPNVCARSASACGRVARTDVATPRGMPWRSSTSHAVDELAAAQHGLVTTAQAVKALGPEPQEPLGAGAAPRLGPAERVPHGRRARDVAPERCMAASLWRSTASCRTARRPSSGASSSRRATSRCPIRRGAQPRSCGRRRSSTASSDLHPELAVERDGLRVTDPVRTVIDLGLVMPWWSVQRRHRPRASRRSASHASPRCSACETRSGGRAATAPASCEQILDGDVLVASARRRASSRSGSSTLARRHGLPPLVAPARGVARRALRRPGRRAPTPSCKLAIEVDGFEHHSTPEAFQRDRTRQNRARRARLDGAAVHLGRRRPATRRSVAADDPTRPSSRLTRRLTPTSVRRFAPHARALRVHRRCQVLGGGA